MLFHTTSSGLPEIASKWISCGVSLLETRAVRKRGHGSNVPPLRHRGGQAAVIQKPAAVSSKFAGQPDYTSRAVGMNKESLKVVRYGAQSVNWTQSPTEVANGIFVTGENPRQNNFENTSGRFFFGEACSQPDSLVDNQALLFDTRDGLAVVLDCGHAGVEIALEYNRLITGNRPIRAVIGGMHLAKARPERVTKTLEAFRRWNIQQIVPGHCTGVAAVAQLRTAFLSQCALCATGTRLISG